MPRTSAKAETVSYRVAGTTDDVTTCEICGKPELRGTVIIEILDTDGNAEDRIYAGTTCAARRVGGTARIIAQAARQMDNRMKQAQEWADEFDSYYFGANPSGSVDRYMSANPFYQGKPDAARCNLASMRQEINAIRNGTLVGTRFYPSA